EVRRQADMRYAGQSYELTIDLGAGASDRIKDAVERFHARHKDFYGHSNPDAPVEFVNLRTVHVHQVAARTKSDPAHSTGGGLPPVAHREAYSAERNGYVRTPIYDRRAMTGGATIVGPAIVEQPDTTVIVHPGQRATMRADLSLLIEVAHAH